MLSQKFLKTFSHNTLIVVAFSGGPDSVFLTEQLLEHGYKNIVLAHFNHHMAIRKGANNTDEIFVKKYAKKHTLPFEIGHWNTPEQSENKARIARYSFLESVRKTYHPHSNTLQSVIVTAHHKNDVAETVLLQFFRSGGIKSLSGITEYDTKRNIFRPLLHIFKSEIIDFLQQQNHRYCIDSSNSNTVFTRNFIRNEVFPLLETRFPNIQEHLYLQAKQFRTLENDITLQAKEFLDQPRFVISQYLHLINEVQAEILRNILIKKAFSRTFFRTFLFFLRKTQKDNISGKKLETKYQTFTVQKGILLIEEK